MRFENWFPPKTQAGPTTYNAWDDDIASLNIFFGQETVTGEIDFFKLNIFFSKELERGISMGPVEFVSSLGGLFGLFLGFSTVSFIEIIYWATVRLWRSFIWKYSGGGL